MREPRAAFGYFEHRSTYFSTKKLSLKRRVTLEGNFEVFFTRKIYLRFERFDFYYLKFPHQIPHLNFFDIDIREVLR